MSNTDRLEPAWLSELSSVDRASARRIIDVYGESLIRRIASVLPTGRAKRGAPPKPVPDTWLLDAYRLFLLSPDASYKSVAATVINNISTVSADERSGRIRALEESLRKIVRSLDKKLWSFGKNELGLIKSMRSVEFDLSASNSIVRDGRAKRTQRSIQWFFMRGHNSQKSAYRLFGGSKMREPQLSENFRPKFSPDQREAMERADAFFQAFDDIIPSDLPISIAQNWYRTVRAYLEDEVAAQKVTTRNPD